MKSRTEFYCGICGMKYRTLNGMRKHYTRSHSAFKHIKNNKLHYEASLKDFERNPDPSPLAASPAGKGVKQAADNPAGHSSPAKAEEKKEEVI